MLFEVASFQGNGSLELPVIFPMMRNIIFEKKVFCFDGSTFFLHFSRINMERRASWEEAVGSVQRLSRFDFIIRNNRGKNLCLAFAYIRRMDENTEQIIIEDLKHTYLRIAHCASPH